MRIFKLFILSIFLISASLNAYAQELPEVVKDESGKYYVHLVEQGQTLYAISIKYAVPVDAIIKANPNVDISGLKIGQTLRIPLDEVDKKEIKKSEISIKRDTIYHTVEKQQTLYSLSKKYAIDIKEIEELNPEVKDGLDIGMVLKIPYTQSKEADEKSIKFAREDSLQFHIVKPKETLYSLSKLYNVSIDSLQLVNNGLPEGLKVGAAIRVPKQNPKYFVVNRQVELLEDSIREENWIQKEAFKIGVFLPFYSTVEDTVKHEDGYVNPKSKIALDYYWGTKLGLDSLKNDTNFWAEVYFFDTQNNMDTIKALMAQDSMHTFDLFVGPLYRTNYEYVSQFAQQFGIPVVSPVKISSRVLLDKSKTIKVYPGEPAQIIHLAKYVVNKFADSNLVFLNTARFAEQDNAKLFKKHANQVLLEMGRTDTINEFPMYTVSKQRILKTLKDSTHYNIVMISENQAYVSELLTILNDVYLSRRGITFSIFGPEKWSTYDNLETSYWMNLDIHVATIRYVNYQDESMEDFIRSYRNRYQAEPTEFSMLGFDVSYYFGKALMAYGPYVDKHLPELKWQGVTTNFDFIQVGAESGYENQGMFIYHIKDYELELVK